MLSVQFNSSGENNYVSADKTDGIEPCVCVILVELYLWGHVLEGKKKRTLCYGDAGRCRDILQVSQSEKVF